MGKSGWLLNTVIFLMAGFLWGYGIVPMVRPDLIGTPASWIFTGIGAAITFLVIKFLIWNDRRESTTN